MQRSARNIAFAEAVCTRPRKGTRELKTKRGTVSDFIRRQGDAPPAEIVKRGAASGLKFSVATVYSVRSHDARRAKKLTHAAKPRTQTAGVSIVHSPNLEGQLRRAIAELGLQRSREVFQRVEASFAGPHAPQ